jgi:hypothetical protein
MLKLLLSLSVCSVCIAVSAAQQPGTMPDVGGKASILIVFAPDAGGAEFQRQLQLIERHSFELSVRNTVVVPVSKAGLADDRYAFENLPVDALEESTLRQQFHVQPDEFLVVLLNDHGAVQIRSANPVDIHALVATLDKPRIR